MALAADRVQPLKIEDSGTGTQTDLFPTGLNKNQDAVEARGFVPQNSSSNDAVCYMTRDASGRLVFSDSENTTPITLTELVTAPPTVDRAWRRHFLLMGG